MDPSMIDVLSKKDFINNFQPGIYLHAVEALFYWQYDDAKSFNGLILSAIAKADVVNTRRIASAFPELCSAFAEWHKATSQEDFFKSYGFRIPGAV